MAKLPAVIEDFAAQTGLDVSDWLLSQTGEHLLVSGIPTRSDADRLHRFLIDRTFMASTVMGDNTGKVWTVIARPITAPPATAQPTRRRRRRHLGAS